jgi:prepilin-type N-terminal cleavage/methylation domain-containing protein
MRAITDAIARRLASERGFTLIEVLVATVLMTIGVMAVVGTFDYTRRTTSSTEAHQVLAHIAQGETEAILANSYASIGTTAAPSPSGSGDPRDPLNYVVGGSPPLYRYDWKTPSATEPIVVGGTLALSNPWSDGRLGGTVYRFVTSVSDPCPKCAGTADYKRVTVVVTLTKGPANVAPTLESTIARQPS